jgi:phosphoribosylanthranilate isomerase
MVFFPPSPRNLTLADARWISEAVPEGVIRVGLTVDADDATLDAILDAVPVDILQLHGRESPDRVSEVRERFGRPVMKAVALAEESDLEWLDAYTFVADQILVDARPPAAAERPGGNGIAFDWRLIRNRRWSRPWMLAGGLTPENVGEAVRLTGAEQVDVSSGVEARPGYKDVSRIDAFVRAARSAERLEA